MLRNYFKIVLLFLYCFILLCCKKENNRSDTQSGTVTAPGIPDASSPIIEKAIGPAGGMLQSADGMCEVIIPAGAFATETHLSVQGISNTNPLGISSGYRILPHIQNLKEKATIRFRYTNEMMSGTAPQSIHAAYQNTNGIWMAVGGTQLDTDKRTISVRTNHFSDWTLFADFFLSPENALVEPDNTLSLEVTVVSDFLEPLEEHTEQPIGAKINSAGRYIKSWSLTGEGQLESNKEEATYKAPSDPASGAATVAVELDLKDKGQYLLLCQIQLDYSGIHFIKDGKPEKFIKAYATKIGANWIINGGNDDATDKIRLSWDGTEGHHSFQASTNNTFLYMPTTEEIFLSNYTINNEAFLSGGGITITSMSASKDYITGNFDVHPTGKFQGNQSPPSGEASGTFRVKKKDFNLKN